MKFRIAMYLLAASAFGYVVIFYRSLAIQVLSHTINKATVSAKRSAPTVSMKKISEERRRLLKEVCVKRGVKSPVVNVKRYLQMARLSRPRLFYSDKYKLLLCEVPKCASTEWRKALLILENDVNTTNPDDIEHEEAFTLAMKHRFLWNRIKSVEELELRLNTYYRVMTVREPLERLVSAFVDKMSNNSYLYYQAVSRQIHKQQGGTDGSLATWEEFVDSVATKNRMDIHWKPYDSMCDPCNIQYDYIAKLETIVQDSNFIADKLGIDRNALIPGDERTDLQHKWKKKYTKYYEKLPRVRIEKLYDIYKGQYELFGYPKPPFLNESVITQL